MENKTLYFDMLFMLIIFIERNRANIYIEDNFQFKLSLENTSLNEDDFSTHDFEEEICLKFKDCIVEFNPGDLNIFLKNCLSVLKGQLFIDTKIEELYFNIFRLMNIGELNHQSFFAKLL